MNERLGIIEERQAIAAKYARFAYIAPQDRLPPPAVEPAASVAAAFRTVNKRLYGHGKMMLAVSVAFDVSVYFLIGPRKTRRIVEARFAAALLLRTEMALSSMQIGRVLRRDHTTVLDGIRRAHGLLETSPEWAERYHAAERLLKGEQ